MSQAVRQTRFDQLSLPPARVGALGLIDHGQRHGYPQKQDTSPPLRLVEAPAPPRKASATVKGLRELRELQKQTIAVLDSVKDSLDDIRQVLRSPEATRGMEKQQNAAVLLAKGFAAEAAVQAAEAVALLPANPDAHLLLSLSLAADQQFDGALAAARKGLALFDRKMHSFPVEAALLHALAALGQGPEAATAWEQLVEAMPAPEMLVQLGRIAMCYPADAPEGQLDRLLRRRLEAEAPSAKPPEAKALLAGLAAATAHRLGRAHRAMLVRIAWQAKALETAPDAVRFVAEYCVALSEGGLTRSSNALAACAVKRMLDESCDALVLHRMLLKLELARCRRAARGVAKLLRNWGRAARRQRRARFLGAAAAGAAAAGASTLGLVLAGALARPAEQWGLWLLLAGAAGVLGWFFLGSQRALPVRGTQPLTLEEQRFLTASQTTSLLRDILSRHGRT